MESECNVSAATTAEATGSVTAMVEKHEAALLMLLGFSVFSVLLAVLYNTIRSRVFYDADNVDTTFDAGGNVSTSLTAVTIASQLLWPGDMLQSATVAVKIGVSGAFWYSTAAAVNITLFPLLSFQFKTRAPGAKTYLQVIQARFGKVTHTLFCFYALLINLVILTAIAVVGVALIQNLVREASPEFCMLIIVTVCGCYSFVGGLGSTFYVCYFNAVMVFALLAVLIGNIFYTEHDELPLLGSLDAIYRKIACLEGPKRNESESYMTFWSEDGVIWAVMGLCLTASITFCDQASWQSRIAAKPVQGVWGFLLATIVWFAVPSTIGTTTGFAYLALSADNSSLALPPDDIDAGLVTAYVAQLVMGRAGAFLVLTMFTMLVMSTGSGEIMAVSSIIVYDIYQTYITPFRRDHTVSTCILCGGSKETRNDADTRNISNISSITGQAPKTGFESTTRCACPRVAQCSQCADDLALMAKRKKDRSYSSRTFMCPHHGEYRMYQDSLVTFKNWCILWVTIAFLPFGLLVTAAGLDLNWVILTGSVATIPCFPGVVLSLVWVKATALGLIVGSISGLVCGISVNLVYASTLEGGLGVFLKNTSQPHAVLAGCCTSFFVSLILTVVVSFCTHHITSEEDVEAVWTRLRQIQNPLHPWVEKYAEEFPDLSSSSMASSSAEGAGAGCGGGGGGQGQQEPSFEQLSSVFRTAKITAVVGCVVSISVLVVIIPGVMASLHVLSETQFRIWFTALQVWCVLMAVVVIVVTPFEEMRSVIHRILENRTLKYSSSTRL